MCLCFPCAVLSGKDVMSVLSISSALPAAQGPWCLFRCFQLLFFTASRSDDFAGWPNCPRVPSCMSNKICPYGTLQNVTESVFCSAIWRLVIRIQALSVFSLSAVWSDTGELRGQIPLFPSCSDTQLSRCIKEPQTIRSGTILTSAALKKYRSRLYCPAVSDPEFGLHGTLVWQCGFCKCYQVSMQQISGLISLNCVCVVPCDVLVSYPGVFLCFLGWDVASPWPWEDEQILDFGVM